MLRFDDDDDGLLASALADLASRRSRGVTIERVDGHPVLGTPFAAALEAAGFVVGYKGLTYRRGRGAARARG